MKRIILILGLAASMGLTGTGSVHAQFVVHDPGHTLLNSTEWIATVKKWVTLSLSTDLLFKVATVTSYFSMNSEGRMSFIEQVKESVEKAAEEMREFNESVRSTVIYKSMKGHNRKTYYQGRLAAFTRHTN